MLMLAGGILYLDSYRGRLIDQRRDVVEQRVEIAAIALSAVPDAGRDRLLVRIGRVSGGRYVVFGPGGGVEADSFALGAPAFRLRDPREEPQRRRVARTLDRVIEFLARTPQPPPFPAAWPGTAALWPEAAPGRGAGVTTSTWRAPDRTDIVTAAAPLGGGRVLHLTADARDITFRVRDERLRSFRLFLFVLGLSLVLSIYLARTIAEPLRALAHAASQVRLGRAREVEVPTLPDRGDEIGQLARALSDMTAALRQRIDAIDAFAADVAHELKNPLASLRSAIETFERVRDPALRARLLEVMTGDVARLDRLVSDIAEASRLDAEMSRARFVEVDLGALAREALAGLALPRGVRLSVEGEAPPVTGSRSRLAQVVRNLADNAADFSPDGGLIRVRLGEEGAGATIAVEDEGPGVVPEQRDAIFERFYSARPEGERFGQHSGLGLAIASDIVRAHGGTIMVEDREGGGARFIVRLPARRC